MIADALAASAAGAALTASVACGVVLGWHVHDLATANRCGCGHAFGMSDKYTGACTAQIRVRQYTQGWAKGWKYTDCPCRAHRQPGLSVAEPLDRSFAEGASTS